MRRAVAPSNNRTTKRGAPEGTPFPPPRGETVVLSRGAFFLGGTPLQQICRVRVPKVTAEHFVPEGLGSALVLPQASCSSCQRATTRIEGTVLRTSLWAVRSRLGIRGKKRKRENAFPVTAIVEGEPVQFTLPIDVHPTFLLLLAYRPPRLLVPQTASPDHIATFWGHALNKRGFREGDRLEVQFDSLVFCQMLAKIAHGYAVAEFGLNAFNPFLRELILLRFQKNQYCVDVADYVGGDTQPYAPSKALHVLGHELVQANGNQYLLVSIRLFSLLGAPVYKVIVGEV